MTKVLSVLYKEDAETGWWTAVLPELPGVVTQGRSLDEAHKHIRDALSLARANADSAILHGESDWRHRDDLSVREAAEMKKEADASIRRLDALQTHVQVDAAAKITMS